MAISVDWANKIIYVPKADTQLVSAGPPEIRQLDTNQFRLDLKALEAEVVDAGAGGMPFDDTHSHNPPVTVGGVTLARVIEIINGYTITFEDGQYAVNLVGSNNNIADVTNVNQVSIRSANSAGLVHIDQLLDQSFQGQVWIDTANGLSGTQYPRGTPTDQVNNYMDASTIASTRKLNSFHLVGDLTLGGTADVSNTNWIGRAPIASKLTLAGAGNGGSTFKEMILEGDLVGAIEATRCHLNDLTGFAGEAYNCVLDGTDPLVLATAPGWVTSLLDCYSGVAGTSTAIIDLTNFTASDALALRSYTGGIRIQNLTANADVSIDMLAGNVIIDSSCTSGTIRLGGVSNLTDNSAGTTVNTDGHIYAKELNDRILAIRSNTAAIIGLI